MCARGPLPPVHELPDDIVHLRALLRSHASGDAPRADELSPVIGELRNVTLCSAAGTMRRRGMTEAEMFAALVVMNADRCRPPLEEREVHKIARSVGRYEPAASAPALVSAGRGRLVYGHEVKLVKPRWLVPGRVPKGGITLVSGDPGQGKSSYACLLAAGVTRGAWGDEPAGVVFASAEDSFAGRIVQRAVASAPSAL
jgi:Primase C terminal 1 (PriCT-1)/AAA domain